MNLFGRTELDMELDEELDDLEDLMKTIGILHRGGRLQHQPHR